MENRKRMQFAVLTSCPRGWAVPQSCSWGPLPGACAASLRAKAAEGLDLPPGPPPAAESSGSHRSFRNMGFR